MKTISTAAPSLRQLMSYSKSLADIFNLGEKKQELSYSGKNKT
jgi:hypothetical protein